MARLPKTIVGATFGYMLGQVLYMFSSDCPERYLTDAPNGEMAALIRKKTEEMISNSASDNFEQGYEKGDDDKEEHAEVLDKQTQAGDQVPYVVEQDLTLQGLGHATAEEVLMESLSTP